MFFNTDNTYSPFSIHSTTPIQPIYKFKMKNFILSREENLKRCNESLYNISNQRMRLRRELKIYSRRGLCNTEFYKTQFERTNNCTIVIRDFRKRICKLEGISHFDKKTRSGRKIRIPERFSEVKFISGSNNSFTKGRKIDKYDYHYKG